MLQRSMVLLYAACCLALTSLAQDDLIDKVYGTSPDRPEGYASPT